MNKLHQWIEAKKKFHLSDMHIQMARELGMNPKKLGGLANHKQERWKSPLPNFIEELYSKRFKKEKPDVINLTLSHLKNKRIFQAHTSLKRTFQLKNLPFPFKLP